MATRSLAGARLTAPSFANPQVAGRMAGRLHSSFGLPAVPRVRVHIGGTNGPEGRPQTCPAQKCLEAAARHGRHMTGCRNATEKDA